MAATNGRNKDHPTFEEPAFEPYALAIGRLALAWNDLHERLATLFCTVLGSESLDRAIAVWNSATFDRARREMFKSAALAISLTDLSKFPKMADELKWLCDRVDNFENIRNDAIHSPLLLNRVTLLPLLIFGHSDIVAPNDLLHNTRASRLVGKDLLSEFNWCYHSVIVLRDYAAIINQALTADAVPWPERPALPNRPHQNQRRKGMPAAHCKE
jgi:hypothetical protein